MGKSKSWSVTKIQNYKSCPKKYDGIYNKGIRSKPGPAAQRGIEIHLKAENYLNGKIRGLPTELSRLAGSFRKLKKIKPMTEIDLSVTDAWKPTSWKKAWCRGKIDALARMTEEDNEAIVIDHKTGRIYPYHVQQAEVYACLTASVLDDVESVHVEFWYLDKGFIDTWDWNLDDISEIKAKWEEEAAIMFSAKRFPATPSHSACKWCPLNSNKGGTCREWQKARS